MKKILQSKVLLPLIVIMAIAFVVFKVKTKDPVEHIEVGYPVKIVEVITARKLPFRSRATAFGNVEPATTLDAKAEVSGKVSFIHPDLKKGASIAAGTVVLQIEATTFEISLDQSRAGLEGSQSTLQQLQVEEQSTREALKIAQANLDVGLKEVERIRGLLNSGLVASSSLDNEEQTVLLLRQQVQDIKGKLDSYASRKAATQAQIKQSESLVSQSQDTLGRTEIRMPFDARIESVSVEADEFTQAGSLLFEALGVKSAEINAELPALQFRPLVAGLNNGDHSATIDLQNPANASEIMSNLGLEARVRLVGDNTTAARWNGTVSWINASVDPIRNTIGLTITVENPYADVIPGIRPPLVKGMYTSVELLSPPRPTMIVPRKAVHQGRVYLATDDNTLSIQPVRILFKQNELVVLDDSGPGSLAGKKLIISDVIPVMQGMPLKLIEATEYETRLAATALGEAE